ncbi:MAG TPA: winged helix-turn-helix domain-containing protein [Actinophytocola sp.]|jgi:hypothetical protein|uniref:winged helix-turn-helix domain-containing protein n=1 Tax=Actinophytocola sp. TaxID=1872138 RepID=UPI002F933C84
MLPPAAIEGLELVNFLRFPSVTAPALVLSAFPNRPRIRMPARRTNSASEVEIIEHLWDVHFDGDPNIVEVYVRRLRAKLGAAAVETVRGAGYRLSGG